MSRSKVPIAITMGDASGVGPEILLRSYAQGLLPQDAVVFGDQAILSHGAGLLGLDVRFNSVQSTNDVDESSLNVVDADILEVNDFTPGELSANAGHAAYAYVLEAAQHAFRQDVSAIVTLPMNKEATQRAHPEFSGHTELLASLSEVQDVVMMLATDEVAVSHVSTHVSLQQAIERLTPRRLERTIDLTAAALSHHITNPRIGVCGLNPHAGENGMFGSEEQEIIEPVIASMRDRGIDVSGPYPADTVFRLAIELDRFDALICMYHDQGHAPMKLFAFDRAVNVTLGLPIIRTSVDHGTAFDIAWQGTARIDSLQHAIRYAQKMIATSDSD